MASKSAGMRCKIALVTTSLAKAGAEIQVLELARRLNERVWDVQVVSLLPPGPLAELLEESGVGVVSLAMRGARSVPRAWLRLVQFVRRFRPDVVHAHMFHANLLARLARLAAPVPVLICTAHSTYEVSSRTQQPRERTWRDWAYRWTDPLCDVTTQVSEAGRDRYVRARAVPDTRIRVVPNGLDTDRFGPNAQVRRKLRDEMGWQGLFVWISVGRLEAPKDHRTLLKAFAQLERRGALLVLVGEGTLRGELELSARSLGVVDRVRFLGARDDIPDLLNGADGYVMSSRWEGLPMALLEAQACAVPVVATCVGGVAQIVQHGVTGFLIPPNDPEALAQAMLRVMELPPEERTRLGEAGRRHIVANYTLDRVVGQWEALYRDLLSRKGIEVA